MRLMFQYLVSEQKPTLDQMSERLILIPLAGEMVRYISPVGVLATFLSGTRCTVSAAD